jgi:deazaflavin-dependent oxidoreductase (nitroreductase family)
MSILVPSRCFSACYQRRREGSLDSPDTLADVTADHPDPANAVRPEAQPPVPAPPLAVIRPFTTRVVNPFTRLFVAWLPWFGVLRYRGRRSGKAYRIPMNVFPHGERYVFALTYGSQVQWVKNVLAAGEAEVEKRGRRTHLAHPRVFVDRRQSQVPLPIRLILRLMRVQEFLEMTASTRPAGAGSSGD